MESDLEELIDFAATGSLFPQFEQTWTATFSDAQACVDRIFASGDGRVRVALKTNDPLTFSALFVGLCGRPVDLFLFNPNWKESEESAALEIASPNWLLENCEGRELRRVGSTSTGKHMRIMIATGGTSGRIRFAIHDWKTLSAAVDGFSRHMDCDRINSHCILPLYHVSGFMQLIRGFFTKGKILYGRLDTFIEESVSEECFLSLVSTQLERLLRNEVNADRLRAYQAIFLGGGPASIGLLQKCRKLKLPIALTYGMTETAAQVATLLPDQFLAGASSQGKPLPHVEINIDSNDSVIRIAAGSLFAGYWGEASREGEFVTSDIGSFDNDGYLTALGRSDGVIITGGEKVNLREIEICIEATGMVREVVAYSVEDAEWGDLLAVAYVASDTFCDEYKLKTLVKERLINYKYPKIWIQRTELPRNEAGKILKEQN